MSLPSNANSINWSDVGKGLLIAVLTAAFTQIYIMVQAWDFSKENWQDVLQNSVTAFMAYLAKNFFTNDVPQAVKTIEKVGGEVKIPVKPTDEQN